MKTFKVIYKGIKKSDDFTLNNIYLGRVIREGLLLVLSDKGVLVEIDSVYFEFLKDVSLVTV